MPLLRRLRRPIFLHHSVTRAIDAWGPNKRKRAFRCGLAPFQAGLRESRRPHRAAKTRVLRETDPGTQAQKGRRRQTAHEAQLAYPDDKAPPTLLILSSVMALKDRLQEDMQA